MRKLCFCVPVLLIMISLTACTPKQSAETDKLPAEVAEAIIASQTGMPSLIPITAENAEFNAYLSNYYLLDQEQIRDGVICYAAGVEASEIAVLVPDDVSTAETVEEILSRYIQNRAGDFEGYAPQQAALAKGGIVVTNGKYVALLMCPDTTAAKTAFLNCFEESGQTPAEGSASMPKSQAPEAAGSVETEHSYCADAVLQAWESGDASSLSERDRSVLNAAKDVIDQKISNGMSEYEKELAIHDWITGWSSFDMSAFSHAPGSGSEEDSDTPYGVLINKRGNCWGYSSTFQLFMDLLGIECITVYGTPSSSGVEHAWNMVQLDEEWYCVDTAWDDPIGGTPGHRYFNVTSEILRNSGIHRWDETAVPEATGTTYRYGNG